MICQLAHSTSRLKNKEDNVVDSFFWPLTSQDPNSTKKSNHNFRSYAVPAPKNDQYKLHDQALYSLWMHYVEFCRMTAKCHKSNNAPKMASQDLPINIFTQRKRLPVFQLISGNGGAALSKDEIMSALCDRSVPAAQQPVAQQTTRSSSPPTIAATPAKAQQFKQVPAIAPHKQSPTSVSARFTFAAQGEQYSAKANHYQQQQFAYEKQYFEEHKQCSQHQQQQQQAYLQREKEMQYRHWQQQQQQSLRSGSGYTSHGSSGAHFAPHQQLQHDDDCDMSSVSGASYSSL